MWTAMLLSLFSSVGRPHRHALRHTRCCRNQRRLIVESLEERSLLAYDMFDLGAFSPYALNNVGQTAGELNGHAVLQECGRLIDLGTLGGATSRANDINNAGQIVGYADTAGGARHAFLVTPEDANSDGQPDRWFRDDDLNEINDLMLDLGTLGGATSEARGINNLGQVVGRADTTASAGSYRAFLWDNVAGMQNLGTFGQPTNPTGLNSGSEATAINDRGQVVGSVYGLWGGLLYNYIRPFRWDPASGGALLGQHLAAKATGINEAGQIVGTSGTVRRGEMGMFPRWYEATDAFVWQGDGMSGLGFANPYPYSDFDVSIDKHAQIVGLGYLWQEGASTNLNTLLDPAQGWANLTTADINDAGQILGRGTHDGTASSFLLSYGTPSQPPTIVIRDVTVTEGNSSAVNAVFTVSVSRPVDQTITVEFSTADGTAIAGSDYQASSGTLTFAPGEIDKTISIVTNGDVRDEYNEAFLVNLTSATHANLADSQGAGTILDNDAPAALTINDVTIVEGNSGVSYAVFTVTLNGATDKTITVNYATSNGTATAGSDYQSASGVLTFNPGETQKTIRITIYGDKKSEKDETFNVSLSGTFNGADVNLVDTLGLGTIKNDDR